MPVTDISGCCFGLYCFIIWLLDMDWSFMFMLVLSLSGINILIYGWYENVFSCFSTILLSGFNVQLLLGKEEKNNG